MAPPLNYARPRLKVISIKVGVALTCAHVGVEELPRRLPYWNDGEAGIRKQRELGPQSQEPEKPAHAHARVRGQLL